MKEDKLREKQEKKIFSNNQIEDDSLVFETIEKKFSKFKNGRFKQKVAAIIFAVLLGASGTVLGARIYNRLNFKEQVYSEALIHTPDFYNDHPIGVCVDTNGFSEKQLKIIKSIFNSIDERCPGFQFNYIDEYDYDQCNIYLYTSKLEQDNLGSVPLGTTKGNMMLGYSEIAINEEFAKSDPNSFESVVTHELLHALGLGHTKDLTNIMFPYNLNAEISEKEFDILNALYPTNQVVESASNNELELTKK